MGNCKFLRQKKQVKINGEWVDTKSYRYFSYCELQKPGITIKNGPSRGDVHINFIDDTKGKTIYLDVNGNGHVAIESNKIIDGISIGGNKTAYPLCEVEVNGCDVDFERFTGMGKLVFSCSRLVDNKASDFEYDSRFVQDIIFKESYTSNATNMGFMFHNYTSLKYLDISVFDTSNVTSMSAMFFGCSRLPSLDI